MIRSTWTRLAALAAGVAVIASCDTATSGVTPPGSSTSSSKTGAKAPTITLDSPKAGTLINLGDSVFVSLHLHGEQSLRSATIRGVTEKGDAELLVDEDPSAIAHGSVGDGRLEALVDHRFARDDFGHLSGRERLLPVEHAGDVRVPVIERQDVKRRLVSGDHGVHFQF